VATFDNEAKFIYNYIETLLLRPVPPIPINKACPNVV